MPSGVYIKTEKHKRNLSIAFTGKKSHFYKDGRTLRKHFCIDCGKELSNYKAMRCPSCSIKESINRPERKKGISGKNNHFYKDGRCLVERYCMDCGKELLNYKSTRCPNCSAKEVMNRPEQSERMRKSNKQNWQDGIFDGVFQSPTNPEREIMRMLKKLKIDYVFQFRPKDFGMVYDFYIPEKNLLIEFDGIYWHSLKEAKLRDIEKTKYANKNGYNLLRINENSLKNFKNVIL